MTGGVLPVWWDGAADGPVNMAADELLAAEADRRGVLVIRFYSWTTPTVSLGAFQRLAEAESCPAIAGLPIVRRPSGGGAILHGTDLTYAAAIPKSHPCGGAPQALYDLLHRAAVDVLSEVGFRARLHVSSDDDPPAEALLCFSRRSPGDVVLDAKTAPTDSADPKVLGSGQRRLGTTVLQHGSLLLSGARAVGGTILHPGLAELAASPIAWNARSLAELWTARLAEAFGAVPAWQPAPFAALDSATIARLATRFLDPCWTGRR